ncbi:M48 family metallopeptidase [uncultured Parabacteroides sp.]|uniref:M48 family metallopeptidase n=1 Tax=uncultured Parabacteroides sp. TaxID=512312 RepID=UPI002618D19A|nr:M48 family metallopeptidase [uncultured Parabacteroides sp.]
MCTHLLGLDSKIYEHPEDRKTLQALTSMKGFDHVVSAFLNWTGVKANYVIHKGSSYHVTEDSCPELFHLVKEAASILDVADLPRVYLEWNYGINGYTTGYKETTMMVLNTGVIDLMSDMEQTFVIGHELGHIKSKHVIYHTMGSLLTNFISEVPIIGFISDKLFSIALMRWSRMSEFTADRAGLLACQDLDAAMKAIIKMSGVPGRYFDRINVDAFLREAEDFEKELSTTDRAWEKAINLFSNDHPWTVIRALELKRWVDSGAYDRILENNSSVICRVCHGENLHGSVTCEYCGSDLV